MTAEWVMFSFYLCTLSSCRKSIGSYVSCLDIDKECPIYKQELVSVNLKQKNMSHLQTWWILNNHGEYES